MNADSETAYGLSLRRSEGIGRGGGVKVGQAGLRAGEVKTVRYRSGELEVPPSGRQDRARARLPELRSH